MAAGSWIALVWRLVARGTNLIINKGWEHSTPPPDQGLEVGFLGSTNDR